MRLLQSKPLSFLKEGDNDVRWKTALLAIAIVLAISTVSVAKQPKASHTKVLVGKRLFAEPNASSPAPIWDGLDAEVLSEYESYSLLSVNKSAVDHLRERGRARAIDVSPRDHFDHIYVNSFGYDARAGRQSLPDKNWDPPYRPGESGLWLVQFIGPIKSDWRRALTDLGCVVVYYLKYNAYLVAADANRIAAVGAMPFVQLTEQIHRFMKPSLSARAGKPERLWIQVAEAQHTADTVAFLRSLSLDEIKTETWSSSERRVEGTFRREDIDLILADPLVIAAVPRPEVGLSDERVALSMTKLAPAAGGGRYLQWLEEICPDCSTLLTGTDKYYIGIADTGLDGGTLLGAVAPTLADPPAMGSLREEFTTSGKVVWGTSFANTGEVFNPSLGRWSDSTNSKHDVYGHGTLVAGIAAGGPTSATDNGGFLPGLGVAPAAGLLITKIDVPRVIARVNPVRVVVLDARTHSPHPAFIQNHSYNQYTKNPADDEEYCDFFYDGIYSVLSRDFDAAVIDADLTTPQREQTLLTVSSGNIHQQDTPELEQGCRDILHALPPATAKNVLAVGMAESFRPWEAGWNCYGVSSQSYDNIASDTKAGTAQNGWYKPDLMVPASSIASSRSSDLYGQTGPGGFCVNGSTAAPPLPLQYLGSSGTSFAAPAAAGAALLASRVYARRVGGNAGSASPALLKAMLIAAAVSMKSPNPSPQSGGYDRAKVTAWRPGTKYFPGDRIIPRAQPNGYVYEADTLGADFLVSGNTEPMSWPTNTGGTVTEQSPSVIRWINVGSEATIHPIQPFPNARQGFGRLNLVDVLSPYPARHFVNQPASSQLSVGAEWENTYRVHDSNLPVRAALVWTDPAAPVQIFRTSNQSVAAYLAPNDVALMNDLNLSIEFGSPCQKYIGNSLSSSTELSEAFPCGVASTFDFKNNVEVARFFASAGMDFKVTVRFEEGEGLQNFALVVLNAYDADDPAPPPQPTLTATATSSSNVRLSWGTTPGSTFEVQRRARISDPFVTIASGTTATTIDDSNLLAGTTYQYRLRLANATGVSPYSLDIATTIVFTDEPLSSQTFVKADHLRELRTAVTAVRSAAGLSMPELEDPVLFAGVTVVEAVHLAVLRSLLVDARALLGVPAMTYIDSDLIATVHPIRAVHFSELRAGVR